MKLTFARLVAALTLVAIFAMAARVAADTDTWWHLRTGQWIVSHQAVPLTDPFSHTFAGQPWSYPSAGWLAEVLMYRLFERFGYAGLNLFTAAFVTLAFVFVYRACEGPPLLRAFVLVLAAAASSIYWSARPQIVSFALAAIFAYVLIMHRRGVNRLWWLPVLMALWANTHGGFAIGFILIGLTLAGQVGELAWRGLTRDWPAASGENNTWRAAGQLAVVGLACALAVMLNPSGPRMLLYPFQTVSITVLREFIQEWQSPNFHYPGAQTFLWLLFATYAAMSFSGRRARLTDFVLVSGVAYLGFLAWRNSALLAVVAPPVLTQHAARMWDDWRGHLPARAEPVAGGQVAALNWLILVLMVGAAVARFAFSAQPSVNEAEVARVLPVKAVEFIRQSRPAGPLFNSYNWGGYLTWALYPDYPVFVDGRTDLYSEQFLSQYLDVILARPGWPAVLDQYGVNLILIESQSTLASAVAGDSLWRAVYQDGQAVVFERWQP